MRPVVKIVLILGFLLVANTALAVTHKAKAGTTVRLSIGDKAHYHFSRGRQLLITMTNCDPDSMRATFEVLKKSSRGQQRSLVAIGAADSGFDVEVLKFACTAASVGQGSTATTGAALITAPNSISFALGN